MNGEEDRTMYTLKNSSALFEQSRQYLAAGVSSNLRLAMKPLPIFIKHAQGARFTDVDGNEYVDYIMAYGPQILGHGHEVIVNAIKQQVEIGQTYGVQHHGEIELAQLITRYVPCADLVSFSSTGSEAVQVALRLSRAYTGRSKVIRFNGHYHGWIDTIFTDPVDESDDSISLPVRQGTAGQNQNALQDIVVLPWNDELALTRYLAEHGHEIAAIITEPVMCNSGCIRPKPGYMQKMRELTMKYGIVLIFDEVITGFRLALGGAQEVLGITPDLVTLGKAVAGGLPLSAVGGRKELMSLIADNRVNHMGTMNGNPLCTAAAIASIRYLAEEDGRAYAEMDRLATCLVEQMNALAKQYSLPLLINRQGPVFHTMFTQESEVTRFQQFQQRDADRFSRFAEQLLLSGIAVRPSGLWYVSAAHTQADIDHTLSVVHHVFKSI